MLAPCWCDATLQAAVVAVFLRRPPPPQDLRVLYDVCSYLAVAFPKRLPRIVSLGNGKKNKRACESFSTLCSPLLLEVLFAVQHIGSAGTWQPCWLHFCSSRPGRCLGFHPVYRGKQIASFLFCRLRPSCTAWISVSENVLC